VSEFTLVRSRRAPQTLAGKLAATVRTAKRVAGLGARPIDRARLAAATFILLVRARALGNRPGRPFTVTLSAFGREARATFYEFSHIGLLEAIFLDGDYAIDPREPPRAIVDLGSNVGLSIVYFRLRFPDARIFGFEPDPSAFALLQHNTEQLDGVTVRHVAVGDRDGTATFWSAPGAVASSLERTHDAQRPVDVPIHTLERLLADGGVDRVDILKLVVEGSEFRALRSLADLTRISAITGEILLVPGDPERDEQAFRTLLAGFRVDLREDKGDNFWQFHAYEERAAAS
jgi:FkbM family methyltransferase